VLPSGDGVYTSYPAHSTILGAGKLTGRVGMFSIGVMHAGSTLFVVWQQARENDAVPGGFRVGRDLHGIFAVPPTNVFLLELAYWLNY
jgi:hypothetical protein